MEPSFNAWSNTPEVRAVGQHLDFIGNSPAAKDFEKDAHGVGQGLDQIFNNVQGSNDKAGGMNIHIDEEKFADDLGRGLGTAGHHLDRMVNYDIPRMPFYHNGDLGEKMEKTLETKQFEKMSGDYKKFVEMNPDA